MSTVNPLEVIWFLIGLGGLIFDMWLTIYLTRDKLRLQGDGLNGADDILITTHIGTSIILFAKHFVIMGLGIFAMVTPPASPENAQKITPVGIAVTLVLFIIAFLTTVSSVWLLLRRLYLRQYLIKRLK